MVRAVRLTAREGVAVLDGPDRDEVGRQRTTITSSTAETTIITADAANFLDLFSLRISNTSASACNVDIRDATAGTIIDTYAIPAGQTFGIHGDAAAALKQAAKNNNWTAQCSASVVSIVISAFFVKRPG